MDNRSQTAAAFPSSCNRNVLTLDAKLINKIKKILNFTFWKGNCYTNSLHFKGEKVVFRNKQKLEVNCENLGADS